MSTEGQWKDKYLQVAQQLETEEKRSQEAERELLRLLSRLCVATTGLDAMLDPHLKRVRKSLREGVNGKLVSQAQRLGDALMQAQDDRVKGDLLARLLDRSSLSSAQVKQATALWRELAQAPGKVSDRQLDKLAALLFGDMPGEDEGGRSGGLFGRLLKRNGSASPNEILLDVIESIEWPENLRDSVEALRERLGGEAASDAWIEVAKQLGTMAATALDRAQRDIEASSGFLAQLNARLEAIDEYMNGDRLRWRESEDSGKRLGKAVGEVVDDMSVSMHAEQPAVSNLHARMLGALSRIRTHVSSHLEEQTERASRAERQAAEMQKQLHALETETFELRRQVEETRLQAMHDSLTGLPNRRALESRAAEELARYRRFGEPLAMLVLDVDDFKQINDLFGHKAGDRALALIGKILTQCLRETDFIARYGGEEFVALLPGADSEAAAKMADLMCRQVEGAGMHSHNKPVEITLSGGVAMAAAGEGFTQLFERADKAMYQAKQQGKNRCVMAD